VLVDGSARGDVILSGDLEIESGASDRTVRSLQLE
jgi:hypothetical protein